jgi:hypothetical protein
VKHEYVPKNFSPGSLRIINLAEQICEDYAAQGFDLTLRQLYYQFVARGYIPNKDTEYKRLGSIINDARLAGLVDWDHIVDRTRNLRALSHWDDPADIIGSAVDSFRVDKWASQPVRIEVWIEKDALVGVLDATCPGLDVPYFSCRGYTSQSEIWGAAQRLNQYLWKGQDVLIIHLGDHDPSGIDMSRDIEDRLKMFTKGDGRERQLQYIVEKVKDGTLPYSDVDLEGFNAGYPPLLREYTKDWGHLTIRRIALNMDQVEEYDPPPNPAKLTDSRSGVYVDTYGDESWELDALDPATLSALITDEVEEARDQGAWDRVVEQENQGRALLRLASRRWDDVKALLEPEEEPEDEEEDQDPS